MPRNTKREHQSTLVQAAKIAAEGVMHLRGVTRTNALEKTARDFGYPDWNRLVADGAKRNYKTVPKSDLMAIDKDVQGKVHTNILVLGWGPSDLREGIVASLILARNVFPKFPTVLRFPNLKDDPIKAILSLRESRKEGVNVILCGPEEITFDTMRVWGEAINDKCFGYDYLIMSDRKNVSIKKMEDAGGTFHFLHGMVIGRYENGEGYYSETAMSTPRKRGK